MLLPRAIGDGKKESLNARLLIAQRLQKPKLLSDMRSFKAANPGAVFQDFVNWYGNPEIPLQDCHDYNHKMSAKDAKSKSRAARARAVEAASESMQVLMTTRNFWSDTWDEAEPCPASEQRPLFDPHGVAETTLHALETIPPAHLLNQVLAANLSAADFALRSSCGDIAAREVPAVGAVLDRLAEATRVALVRLGEDVSRGFAASTTLGQSSHGRDGDGEGLSLWRHSSKDAIAACEAACDAVGDAEIVLSRAATLLDKFPGEYALVQGMLEGRTGVGGPQKRCRGLMAFPVDTPGGRWGFLSAVRRQQELLSGGGDGPTDDIPLPSTREYVLCNCNQDEPSRLSVCLGGMSEILGEDEGSNFHGGLILAISKCEREY